MRTGTRALLEAPLRRPLLLLVPTLLSALLGLGLTTVLPPRYSATALLRTRVGSVPEAVRRRLDSETPTMREKALVERLCASPRLETGLEALRRQDLALAAPDLPRGVAQVRAATSVRLVSGDTYRVSVSQADPVASVLLLELLVDQLVEESFRQEQVREDAARLESQLADVRREVAAKQAAVTASRASSAPGARLAAATREYAEAQGRYASLLERWQAAEIALRLQAGREERFEVVEPAQRPGRPEFPDPLRLATGGFALGLVLGLGLALVAELRDPSVKDAQDLQALLGRPLLASIPFVRSRRTPSGAGRRAARPARHRPTGD